MEYSVMDVPLVHGDVVQIFISHTTWARVLHTAPRPDGRWFMELVTMKAPEDPSVSKGRINYRAMLRLGVDEETGAPLYGTLGPSRSWIDYSWPKHPVIHRHRIDIIPIPKGPRPEPTIEPSSWKDWRRARRHTPIHNLALGDL